MNFIRQRNVAKLIDSQLGERVKQAKYSYSDIILSWIYSNICGAERLEDTTFLRHHLNTIPGSENPSPDRIAAIFKNLATQTVNVSNHNKVTSSHEFCWHEQLNGLLLDIALELKALNREEAYTLDYDNVIIENAKYDARSTYEKNRGYQPGVSFIAKTPVYIEGRNGNSTASLFLADSVRNALDKLNEKGIRVNKFRSDSAAYQVDVLKLMEEKDIEFFIRLRHSRNLDEEVSSSIVQWKDYYTDAGKYELASVEYFPSKKIDKSYRAVVTRSNGIVKDGYHYYAIITNNRTMTDEEVVKFYNNRGAIERNFDDLKNNFNWKRLPFSFLNENTVFMYIGAIASVIYYATLKALSKRLDFVNKKWRLKNFILNFITVSSEWLKNGKLKLYTDKEYELAFA